MATLDLDQPQAQAILDMQLRRIAALERERIENEYRDLQKTIGSLESLLADPQEVLEEVKKETQALRKRISIPRRTDISGEVQEFSREELEAHEQIVITLSAGGYIKRIPASTYRNQHRGGKGVSGMNIRDQDPVRQILVCDTHDVLLFFTNRGRVLSLRSYELRADSSRNTRGVPIVNVIPLSETEKVNALVGVRSLKEENRYLVMTTRKGSVKRVSLGEISKIRKAGLIIMFLKSDDELVTAHLTRDEDDVIMVSEQGMSIRFPVAAITARHRAAGGVRGMSLGSRDRIVSMDVVIADSKLLVISKKGFGKLTDLNRYRRQGRGGSGIKTLNITKKTGAVAAAEVIADSDEVYVVSQKAQVIRTSLSEIRNTGRATQGVTIFKPQPGDSVSAIACVSRLSVTDHDQEPDAPNSNEKLDGVLSTKALL